MYSVLSPQRPWLKTFCSYWMIVFKGAVYRYRDQLSSVTSEHMMKASGSRHTVESKGILLDL